MFVPTVAMSPRAAPPRPRGRFGCVCVSDSVCSDLRCQISESVRATARCARSQVSALSLTEPVTLCRAHTPPSPHERAREMRARETEDVRGASAESTVIPGAGGPPRATHKEKVKIKNAPRAQTREPGLIKRTIQPWPRQLTQSAWSPSRIWNGCVRLLSSRRSYRGRA